MKIHKLPAGLAMKIAAGEVIERPLSVVKELIENSIDAQSSSVDVELIQGGKVLISVKDNGSGIEPDELPLAVEKHATSKISEESDLDAIMTLGYRGEALCSVGAVSQLEIFSRRAELPEGASLRLENGTPKISRLPLRPGTTVIVKDLFYNLPARRKFMKTAAAEFRRISRLIQDYAIAYPLIAFSLVHDGKNVFKSDGSGSVERLLEQIWGPEPEIRRSVYQSGPLSVTLWWQDCGPQSRFQLISFVNGRRVGDAIIRSGLQSFTWASRGNWLAMISLPPEDIDVNVHPAKTEILFRHSGDVYDLLRRAAEKFARGFSEAPVSIGKITDSTFQASPERHETPLRRPPIPEREPHPFSRMEEPPFRASSPQGYERQTQHIAFPAAEPSFRAPEEEAHAVSRAGAEYLGQLPQGYLIFSNQDGLLIVDPHAAHERVNYERILKASASPEGQESLIMPIPLPPSLKDDACARREQLAELSFKIDGDGSLSRLPVHAKALGISPIDLLRSALNALDDHEDHLGSLKERWAMKACKASVKLTTRLEPAEALQLLEELERCDQPNACPHGRPTVLRLDGGALDKHFGRLGL